MTPQTYFILPDLNITHTYEFSDRKPNRRRGSVTINGVHFANFYTNADDVDPAFEAYRNKVIFNRDGFCFEVNFPVIEKMFNTVEEMMECIVTTIDQHKPAEGEESLACKISEIVK